MELNINTNNLRIKKEIRSIFTETLVSIPKLIDLVFTSLNSNLIYKIESINIKELEGTDGIYELKVKATSNLDFINYDIEINISKKRIRVHPEYSDYILEYTFKNKDLRHVKTIYYNTKKKTFLERKYTSKGLDYLVASSDGIDFKHYVFIYKNKNLETKINIYIEVSENLDILAFKDFLLNEETLDMKSPEQELQLKIFLWLNFRGHEIFAVRMNNEVLEKDEEEKHEKIIMKRRNYESE